MKTQREIIKVDREALRTLLEWCRDAIDFNDETDSLAATAYIALVKPMLAKLSPEEDAEWNRVFSFYAQEGNEIDDVIAHRTWEDMCVQFPRLKDFMGAL